MTAPGDPGSGTAAPRKNAGKTRGRPFQPGNSGRPKGARNWATRIAEEMLDAQAEGLVQKAIELGLGGDVAALRLLLDRILPPRRDRPVDFALPPLTTLGDAVAAQAAIVTAVAEGSLTPGEASELSNLIGNVTKAIETMELEQRVHLLEEAAKEERD